MVKILYKTLLPLKGVPLLPIPLPGTYSLFFHCTGFIICRTLQWASSVCSISRKLDAMVGLDSTATNIGEREGRKLPLSTLRGN